MPYLTANRDPEYGTLEGQHKSDLSTFNLLVPGTVVGVKKAACFALHSSVRNCCRG